MRKSLFALALAILSVPAFPQNATKVVVTSAAYTASNPVPVDGCVPVQLATEYGSTIETIPSQYSPAQVTTNGNSDIKFYADSACTNTTLPSFTSSAGGDQLTIYAAGVTAGTDNVSYGATHPGHSFQAFNQSEVVAQTSGSGNCGTDVPSTAPGPESTYGLTNLVYQFDASTDSGSINWSSSGATSGSKLYAWNNGTGNVLLSSQVTFANGCMTINTSPNTYSYGLQSIGSLSPTSGTFSYPFGIEIRMQAAGDVPNGNGTGSGWPALATYGMPCFSNSDCAELDVIEDYPNNGVGDPFTSLYTLHEWPNGPGHTGGTQNNPDYVKTEDGDSNWHVYDAIVTQSTTYWYKDGRMILSTSNANFPSILADYMYFSVGTSKSQSTAWPITIDYIQVWN